MENHERSGFVQSRLPWIIAAAALVLYLITLNRWMSLASLPVVSSITDPKAPPPLNGPLHFVLTYPFRWLPPSVQLVGLNLFAAACGALTLALLARSVALLPHDRTREQRQRERSEFSLLSIPAAWAPPLFAALVCGLQLTFWENATAATGEMFDLLLFASLIGCLLEYRIDQRESWLTRMALVYGLATTNNYALIAYFPGFLAALIWIKGRSFFEFRFLARMLGLGVVGLTPYLLLPLVSALNEHSGTDFWTSLRLELVGQKNSLLLFPRYLLLTTGLTSLLPVLVIAIRWPSSFGDTSAAGSIITNLMFRVVHGMFLVAGLWVAFDSPFSPRARMDKLVQQADDAATGIPMLSLYYLGALCIGYFVGYYLLVFGTELEKKWQRATGATRLLNRFVTAIVWVSVVAVPLGLVYKNFPLMRASNGTLLREFARTMSERLLQRDAVALCDQPYILTLVQSGLSQSGRASENPVAYTRLLPYALYQRALHERFPKRWPEVPDAAAQGGVLDPAFLIYQITELSRAGNAFYLHPSFGYYFETMFLEPHGPIYKLSTYATNAVTPPPLTPALFDENQHFWSQTASTFDRLASLSRRDVYEARAVARWYSRAVNYWGVELQKAGRLKEAQQCFEQAHKLNPENLPAEINFNFNHDLQAGAIKPLELGQSVQDKFGRFRDWSALLAANGPVDEPGFCFRLGQTLAQQSLFRQAALQFLRVQQLDPANLENRFWLANMFLTGQIYDKALEVTDGIRNEPSNRQLTVTNLIELARLEALAHFGKGEFETAEKLLLDARRQYSTNNSVLDTLSQIYLFANKFTNALVVIDEQLKLAPDNLRALLNKGAIQIQTKSYKEALIPLNKVLKLQPENRAALMNRAIAYLQSNDLAAAQKDYEALQKLMPTLHAIYYGLGEIAYRQKGRAAAIQHYESYLKYAPPVTEENKKEIKMVTERLDELKKAGR